MSVYVCVCNGVCEQYMCVCNHYTIFRSGSRISNMSECSNNTRGCSFRYHLYQLQIILHSIQDIVDDAHMAADTFRYCILKLRRIQIYAGSHSLDLEGVISSCFPPYHIQCRVSRALFASVYAEGPA